MNINENLSMTFDEPEIAVLWKVLQYYHEIENNHSEGIKLSEREEAIRDRLHSGLWYAAYCISMKKVGE